MRRAFTLLEVIVALTIAGLIALAARAALVAGLDTQERLQFHATRTESDTRFRALTVQALRHMTEAPAAGIAPFVLRDTVTQAGPSHIVEFYSRGLAFPAGTGPASRVRLAPSERGLTIVLLHADGTVALQGEVTDLAAIRARLQTQAGEWIEAWPRSLQIPAAVVFEFVPLATSRSATAPVPLVVTTQLAGGGAS
ncbi:MAG: prepilin-type N-terminal cleavage/methylation domain-containing protein [Gemmatimonadaceae bacterium]